MQMLTGRQNNIWSKALAARPGPLCFYRRHSESQTWRLAALKLLVFSSSRRRCVAPA